MGLLSFYMSKVFQIHLLFVKILYEFQLTLVEIRSFDRNTFRQTFSRFGHVIRSYFGYAYKIRHQIECRLLYCIKLYIISVSIPFGKLSANIQPFRSCESVKVQLGLKFGKEIKTN